MSFVRSAAQLGLIGAFAACSALRHPAPQDLGVYEAVIEKLSAAERIDGMRVTAWLAGDGPDECDAETRDFLEALPHSSPSLVTNYCLSRERISSLSGRQRRSLSALVPSGQVKDESLRDLQFSYIGYDDSGTIALVFLRRQVAKECDVGEYFLLRREAAGWEVADHARRWIS
jgi:hypothetical protein